MFICYYGLRGPCLLRTGLFIYFVIASVLNFNEIQIILRITLKNVNNITVQQNRTVLSYEIKIGPGLRLGRVGGCQGRKILDDWKERKFDILIF